MDKKESKDQQQQAKNENLQNEEARRLIQINKAKLNLQSQSQDKSRVKRNFKEGEMNEVKRRGGILKGGKLNLQQF